MSFLLVTAFDDAYDVGFLCAASHEAYAQKHGYEQKSWILTPDDFKDLCQGRAPQWAKVALLQRLLHAIPGAKAEAVQPSWIVWLDADALLLDFETRLEDLLEDFDLILAEDMSCASELNTGVMFVRTSSTWVATLLDEVWKNADPRWYHRPFHEQTALSARLCAVPRGTHASGTLWWSWQGGPRRKVLAGRVLVLDCGTLNFKHPEQRPFAIHLVDDHRRFGGPSKAERVKALLQQPKHQRGCVAVAAGAEASCPALVEATGPEEGIRLSILLE
ncbi:unnamed protein product [Durusdinium trenchii]|uniref:Uncharacterized protein n=1 Tax=Durusdinium trenchii TaxID=1381693 RepID=A0ABP0QHN4_9DINO